MSEPNNYRKYCRLPDIIGPNGILPISRSSFYSGIKNGKFPAPFKVGPRTSVWNRTVIEALLQKLEAEGGRND